MRHDDRRSDFVQQLRATFAPGGVSYFDVGNIGSALRCNQLRQIRGPDFARAGPLRVKLRKSEPVGIGLFGALRSEHSRDLIEGNVMRGEGTIEIGMKWRTAMAGTIDDINFVALLHQQCGPAWSAIRCTHPIGALAAATVHQHDRIRMADPGGDLIFDVHLFAVDHRAARNFGAFHSHPEKTPFGEVEWGFLGGSGAPSLSSQWCGGAQHTQDRQRARGHGRKIPAGKLILRWHGGTPCDVLK